LVKIRVQGEKEEVEKFIEEIKKCNVEIIEQSQPYANRGSSVYSRTYLDVKIK